MVMWKENHSPRNELINIKKLNKFGSQHVTELTPHEYKEHRLWHINKACWNWKKIVHCFYFMEIFIKVLLSCLLVHVNHHGQSLKIHIYKLRKKNSMIQRFVYNKIEHINDCAQNKCENTLCIFQRHKSLDFHVCFLFFFTCMWSPMAIVKDLRFNKFCKVR